MSPSPASTLMRASTVLDCSDLGQFGILQTTVKDLEALAVTLVGIVPGGTKLHNHAARLKMTLDISRQYIETNIRNLISHICMEDSVDHYTIVATTRHRNVCPMLLHAVHCILFLLATIGRSRVTLLSLLFSVTLHVDYHCLPATSFLQPVPT